MNPYHGIAATASAEAGEGQGSRLDHSFAFSLRFPSDVRSGGRFQVAGTCADMPERSLLYSVACLLYSMCRPLLSFWSSTG